MNHQIMKRAVAVALFGAAMLGSVFPSEAAPISPSTTPAEQAASSSGVTEIYYRRHYYRGRGYYGAAPGAAIGLGILGAAAGAAAYGAYGGGYYGPGYAPGYAPGYYGNPYPYRRQYYAPY